jgi:uncharacterized membrane protein YphA (DoxX/SURF4 family)
MSFWRRWLDEPVPLVRLEIVRILLPLVVLGFMSQRIVHAEHWIGDAGFSVPDLGHDDYRQPLYVPPLPAWAVWTVVTTLIASGISSAVGFKTRASALVFAAMIAFVALADRLAAYSVSKLSPVIMTAVAVGSAGRFFSVDAYLKRRRGGKRWKAERPSGAVRFLQVLPVVLYMASGIAKARADWLHEPLVLWSQIHGSYQTWIAYGLARVIPAWMWTAMQGAVLSFEVSAPLLFALRRTRTFALVFGFTMHLMVALLFGPVVWFSLLMMTLLVAGYLPERFLPNPQAWPRRRKSERRSSSLSPMPER